MSYVFGNAGCLVFEQNQNISLQVIKQVFTDEYGEIYDDGTVTFLVSVSGLAETLVHVKTETIDDSLSKSIIREFINLVQSGKDIDIEELILIKEKEHEEALQKAKLNKRKLKGKKKKKGTNILPFPKSGD